MKFIIILFAVSTIAQAVNSTNLDAQCMIDLNNKQVCQQNDSFCLTSLNSFNKCVQECSDQNSQDQYANIICIMKRCQKSNIKVREHYENVVECLKQNTTYEPNSPQINSDQCLTYLFDLQNSGTVCKKGDTDCITESVSLQQCANQCKYLNSYDQRISCLKNNCHSKNLTIQSYLNNLYQCESRVNSKGSTKQTSSSMMVQQFIIMFVSFLLFM
ncbi:hypothetical protein ABPG74_007340 [Tetrahymena malaccensis]